MSSNWSWALRASEWRAPRRMAAKRWRARRSQSDGRITAPSGPWWEPRPRSMTDETMEIALARASGVIDISASGRKAISEERKKQAKLQKSGFSSSTAVRAVDRRSSVIREGGRSPGVWVGTLTGGKARSKTSSRCEGVQGVRAGPVGVERSELMSSASVGALRGRVIEGHAHLGEEGRLEEVSTLEGAGGTARGKGSVSMASVWLWVRLA